MIVYLDASALVKRYIRETGSAEVSSLLATASLVGTAIVSRVEVVAALAKAARMKLVARTGAAAAVQSFTLEWESFVRLQLSEPLVSRAAGLSWAHGLRGYDAMHLAAGLFWQEMMGEAVTMATYDWQLWDAAQAAGLAAWPANRGS